MWIFYFILSNTLFLFLLLWLKFLFFYFSYYFRSNFLLKLSWRAEEKMKEMKTVFISFRYYYFFFRKFLLSADQCVAQTIEKSLHFVWVKKKRRRTTWKWKSRNALYNIPFLKWFFFFLNYFRLWKPHWQ